MININDYPFLRNDFELPNPIKIDDVSFPTVEHAFQASKTNDVAQQEHIASLSVRDARKFGRELDIDIFSWDTRKYFVMENLIKAKFEVNESLAKQLISLTGRIVMLSDRDSYWGVDPDTDVGENNMGVILTGIRDDILLKADVLSFTDHLDDLDDNNNYNNKSNTLSVDLAVLTTKLPTPQAVKAIEDLVYAAEDLLERLRIEDVSMCGEVDEMMETLDEKVKYAKSEIKAAASK